MHRIHHHAAWTCTCSATTHDLAAQAGNADAQLISSTVQDIPMHLQPYIALRLPLRPAMPTLSSSRQLCKVHADAPIALHSLGLAARAGSTDAQLTSSAVQGPACSPGPAAHGCPCAGTASA